MVFEHADITAPAVDAADASAGPLLAAKAPTTPPTTPRSIEQPDAEPEPAAEAAPSLESVSPLVEHPSPVTRAAPANLVTPSCVRLGDAFSFMCTLRMDGTDNWSRVFDFSLNADEDSITAGAIELTSDLHFTVFRGSTPFSVRVNDFFVLGKESVLLCTVSTSGHMKVYKDGLLVGENKEGMSPLKVERPHMFVGGHYLFHEQAFRGTIKGVKVWDREVSWPAPGVLSSAVLRRTPSGSYAWVDWIPPERGRGRGAGPRQPKMEQGKKQADARELAVAADIGA